MTTHEVNDTTSSPRFADLVRAEAFRWRRPGGAFAGTVTAFAVGVGCGFLTLLLMVAVAPSSSPVALNSALELCAFVTILLFALVVAGATGGDARGHVACALTVVPNRGRLHRARALTASVTGLVVGWAALLLVAVAGLAVSAGFGFAVLPWIAGFTLVAAPCIALLGFALGVITRSGAGAVFAMLSLFIALPLGVPMLVGFAPPPIAGAMTSVAAAMPGHLLTDALALTSLAGAGPGRNLGGLLGLIAWGVGTLILADVLFRRRDVRFN